MFRDKELDRIASRVNLHDPSYEELKYLADSCALNFICCLTREQLLDLKALIYHMSDEEVALLRSEVCCRAGAGAGALGTPGPSTKGGLSECQQGVVDMACSSAVQAIVRTLIDYISKNRDSAPDQRTRVVLIAIETMLTALQLLCVDKTRAEETIAGLCLVWNDYRDNGSTGRKIFWVIVTTVLGPVFRTLIELLGDKLDACCRTPQPGAPAWATDIVKGAGL